MGGMVFNHFSKELSRVNNWKASVFEYQDVLTGWLGEGRINLMHIDSYGNTWVGAESRNGRASIVQIAPDGQLREYDELTKGAAITIKCFADKDLVLGIDGLNSNLRELAVDWGDEVTRVQLPFRPRDGQRIVSARLLDARRLVICCGHHIVLVNRSGLAIAQDFGGSNQQLVSGQRRGTMVGYAAGGVVGMDTSDFFSKAKSFGRVCSNQCFARP